MARSGGASARGRVEAAGEGARSRVLAILVAMTRAEILATRARLAKLEPRAEIETLPGATHAATLTLPPELLARIETWCRRAT